MNKGTAKRIAVMIRRRLFSLLKYPKFPLDTFEDVFALLCFLFLFFFHLKSFNYRYSVFLFCHLRPPLEFFLCIFLIVFFFADAELFLLFLLFLLFFAFRLLP